MWVASKSLFSPSWWGNHTSHNVKNRYPVQCTIPFNPSGFDDSLPPKSCRAGDFWGGGGVGNYSAIVASRCQGTSRATARKPLRGQTRGSSSHANRWNFSQSDQELTVLTPSVAETWKEWLPFARRSRAPPTEISPMSGSTLKAPATWNGSCIWLGGENKNFICHERGLQAETRREPVCCILALNNWFPRRSLQMAWKAMNTSARNNYSYVFSAAEVMCSSTFGYYVHSGVTRKSTVHKVVGAIQ